ncbi:restriction endonuclease subunit S [Cellvibrio sp. pealriver]|uniref:restriction endonuclease subunit S n=1 Tax=Cellvibrio sp. pealriver TaxID=1622269 RepID=UPI00066FD983|nr:hypothetical protein [Cellvibrio sp. pealriver]
MRLVSWIGGNDLDAAEAKTYQTGAVAATLASATFTELHLLYSYPERRVSNYLSWLSSLHGIPVAKRKAESASPEKVKSLITKNNRGVRQANISNSDIYELSIPIPEASKLAKFDEAVAKVQAMSKSMLLQCSESHAFFKSLSQRAFSGDLQL